MIEISGGFPVQFNTAESGRRQLRSSTTNAAFVLGSGSVPCQSAVLFGTGSPSQIPPPHTHIRNLQICSGFLQSFRDSSVSATVNIVMLRWSSPMYTWHDSVRDHDYDWQCVSQSVSVPVVYSNRLALLNRNSDIPF